MIDQNDPNYLYYLQNFNKFTFKGQFPAGWEAYIPYLKQFDKLKILDIGCGDLRFANFLQRQDINWDIYVGVDQIDYGDNNKFANIDLYITDIVNYISNCKDKFNFIVIFNTLYHFDENVIKNIFISNLARLIESNGYLAFSLWDFTEILSLQENLEFDKASDSYHIKNKTNNTFRQAFNHINDDFLTNSELILEKHNLKFQLEFNNIDKNDSSNIYFLYKKVGN